MGIDRSTDLERKSLVRERRCAGEGAYRPSFFLALLFNFFG